MPMWQTDILPVPSDRPGPWRLRLSFGSNTLWRFKGWFVASLDPISSDSPAGQFAAQWNGDLSWTWPWGQGETLRFVVQQRDGPESSWTLVADELFVSVPGENSYALSGDRVLPFLQGPRRQRHELRVMGFFAQGRVATREIVVFPDGGDGQPVTLSLPWPNPARDSVRFLVDIPPGQQGRLGIFDLRGRRLFDRNLGSGSRLVEWDGRVQQGGRAPSGTYIIRLEGSRQTVMRKVVLIH